MWDVDVKLAYPGTAEAQEFTTNELFTRKYFEHKYDTSEFSPLSVSLIRFRIPWGQWFYYRRFLLDTVIGSCLNLDSYETFGKSAFAFDSFVYNINFTPIG